MTGAAPFARAFDYTSHSRVIVSVRRGARLDERCKGTLPIVSLCLQHTSHLGLPAVVRASLVLPTAITCGAVTKPCTSRPWRDDELLFGTFW
jgi:hypothetical protein